MTYKIRPFKFTWKRYHDEYVRWSLEVVEDQKNEHGHKVPVVIDAASLEFLDYCGRKKGRYPETLQAMIDFKKKNIVGVDVL